MCSLMRSVTGSIVAVGVLVFVPTVEASVIPDVGRMVGWCDGGRQDGGQRALPIAQRDGCGHRSPCGGRKRYPPEQLSAPGWCDSHFVVDRSGRRVHRCPRPWTRKEIERYRAGRT